MRYSYLVTHHIAHVLPIRSMINQLTFITNLNKIVAAQLKSILCYLSIYWQKSNVHFADRNDSAPRYGKFTRLLVEEKRK